MSDVIDFWKRPAVIAKNNFVYKSLSCWSLNIAVGCLHACRFCYVPEASTNKLAKPLSKFGVEDPDEQWGQYALLRPWDERAFMHSLRAAESTARENLNPDGNRAVMLCTTTDPYQTSSKPHWNSDRAHLVRLCLEKIRDHSTLNVRILTRSPLARSDFDLYRTFGNRLLFGMSLPTLRNDLSRVYEPKAPAPSQRLATLRSAHEHGLNVYVAMAPTYPECDYQDIEKTLVAIKDVSPMTIFHEPINIRAENVERIRAQAEKLGITLQTDVFGSQDAWRDYSVIQLLQVQSIAFRLGIKERLHLWPDASLGSKDALTQASKWTPHSGFESHLRWLESWWKRISEWPT